MTTRSRNRATAYLITIAAVLGLTLYCEVNSLFVLWPHMDSKPWQCILLIFVSIVLVALVLYDWVRGWGALEQQAVRSPGFWGRARAYYAITSVALVLLAFLGARATWHYGDLRFLRRSPEPVVQLRTDFVSRYAHAATCAVDTNLDFYESMADMQVEASRFEYHHDDPTDNPRLIHPERPPDSIAWAVYKPEETIIVGSLHASWTRLGAEPGAVVRSVATGRDLGATAFHVELSEVHMRRGGKWVLVDADVEVTPMQ